MRKTLPCCVVFLSLIAVMAVPGCGPRRADPSLDREEARINEFITNYFSSWSEQDMQGYLACFDEKAVIFYRDDNGAISRFDVDPFIDLQEQAHARSSVRMVEVPTAIHIEKRRNLAQVTVRWMLSRGASADEGTDCFTLVMTDDGWRIISLVFEGD